MSDEPLVLRVGGVQLSVAEPLLVPGLLTAMLNARSEVRLVPSLALITMFEYVPTCDEFGVPVNAPVLVLKLAQLGRLLMDHVSERPSGSDPLGRNEYALPETTDVDGVPLTVGARLPPELLGRCVLIENAGSDAVPVELRTEIRMFDQVAAAVGVPP